MKNFKITNENIVFQNWEDIKKKVLKNSEWKFIRINFGEILTDEPSTLIFENQWGIRAYLTPYGLKNLEVRQLNGGGKIIFNSLTDELKERLTKVSQWNLQFGRKMWGLTAPNQNIEVKELKSLGFGFKKLEK